MLPTSFLILAYIAGIMTGAGLISIFWLIVNFITETGEGNE